MNHLQAKLFDRFDLLKDSNGYQALECSNCGLIGYSNMNNALLDGTGCPRCGRVFSII